MALFPYGHATHPQWQMAASLVLAQLRAQMATPGCATSASLALLYVTDAYQPAAEEILAYLSAELPMVTDWSGMVGVGLAVNSAEYMDEPAMAVMLCDVPADQFRVFSGVAPLTSGPTMGFEPGAALVHADGQLPDLAELLVELAGRMHTGYLFGGVASGRTPAVQFAVSGNGNVRGQGAASGVFHGGVSGVAWGADVDMVSRVTQGCQPLPRAATHRVDEAQGNLVLTLDGRPALAVLLGELGLSLSDPPAVIQALRTTLVGLSGPGEVLADRKGHLGSVARVRHLIGVDTQRQGVAIAETVPPGSHLVFCQRNAAAARADLVRICTEIREALEPAETELPWLDAPADLAATWAAHPRPVSPTVGLGARHVAGAVYVSCVGRGGPYFGAPSAEMQIIRHALGDVPLVGFFAGGEIAHHHLHGYAGVLTVFAAPAG